MRAQRVVLAVTAAESWTVVDADFVAVGPAERYPAYLAGIERSPNTLPAYAQSLAFGCGFSSCAESTGQLPWWRTSPDS